MTNNIVQTIRKPKVALEPLWKFVEVTPEKCMEEIKQAVDTLNARMKDISPSKQFSQEYLELIAKAEAAANAGKWDEARNRIWEATFLVNRAVESIHNASLRFWLALSPLLSFLILYGFERLTNYLSMHHCISSTLMLTYFPFLWTGAIGGTTIVYWGLIKHTIDMDFDDQYTVWYVLKPLLGAITAVVSVLIVKAGLFSLQGTSDIKTGGELTLYVIAFLAGFSERFFIQMVDRVLTALFGAGQSAAQQKTAAPSPAQPPQTIQSLTTSLTTQQQKEKNPMPLELNEKNLKEAYCKAIACTGIGAAEQNCDEVLPKIIKVVVPQQMHADYPAKMLACVVKVCTRNPYYWTVEDKEPTIDDNTTFQSLWSTWLTHVVHG